MAENPFGPERALSNQGDIGGQRIRSDVLFEGLMTLHHLMGPETCRTDQAAAR